MKEYSKWKSGKRFLTAAVTLSLLGSLGLYHDVRADFLEDMEKKYPDAIQLTNGITGEKDKDDIYVNRKILKDNGENYLFTTDAIINTANGIKIGDLSHPVNIDASGQTLIFNAERNNKKLELHAIEIESLQGTTITAKKIFINAGNTKSRAEGIRVGGQNGTNKDTPYKLTINGDMDIRAHGANYGLGMYLCGNAETTVNGNVTMNTHDEKNPWAVYVENDGGFSYYGGSAIYAGNNYTLQMGPKLTVNGLVDLKVNANGVFANGASRYLSHDLTDLIQSNIVRDIRTLYEPRWTRRGKWNQSYYEARVPRVPTMLLELLSHQNFADMRYGIDPRFRFTVSRAIYKGMLQFLCSQYRMDYIVQPLPVDHMALRMIGENEIELSWKAVNDPLEPTAAPEKYIVYTRIGNGDFDNGTVVDKNSYRTVLPPGIVCSYKVTALNKGGESFPSEILSAGQAFNSKGAVLVINGFDRISAPADFVAPAPADTLLAGFLDDLDHGVPYIKDISYIGKMKEFRRSIPWMDDDASGFGDCYGNYETQVIAGNTFDYPAVHGAAILKAGYSFVSCSDEAVESGQVVHTPTLFSAKSARPR